MKIILMLLCVFAANIAAAQPKILTKEDFDKENLKSEEVLENYSPETDMTKSRNSLNLFSEQLKKVFPDNLNPGIAVDMRALINADGAIDYLIFTIDKPDRYNKDSLNRMIKQTLSGVVSHWKLTEKPTKPIQLTMFGFFGKYIVKREVRKADSSVVTLEDAVAFADTLKIKRLFFNRLELKAFPEVTYRFPNLEELYLSDNELEKLAIDFTRLPNLKQLHVQSNLLTQESLILSKNNTLEILNLKENKLTDIPSAARKCKKLTSLWLGGNTLSGLSNRSFRKLNQVKDLNLYKSDLTVLPKGIKKMKNLEVLDLYYNRFENLPNTVTRLRNLTHLAISYNQLKSLPAKMHRLKKVHTFYAHHNRLSVLPENISKMEAVNILDLGFNWFTNFPAEVASLKDLKELDISSNNFTAFPEKILEIRKLDKVYLQGNPFVKDDIGTKYARQLSELKQKNVEVFY